MGIKVVCFVSIAVWGLCYTGRLGCLCRRGLEAIQQGAWGTLGFKLVGE